MADQTATASDFSWVGYVDTSRAITYLPDGHTVRATDHLTPGNAEPSKWEQFGRAVLGFHRRMGATAMCQCGTTMRACDVWAQAAQYGIRSGPE